MMGCTRLGILYRRGAGVAVDHQRAAALLQKGCNGGDILGCSELGALYASGEGITQDFARAATLLQQGCDKKILSACVGLGKLYMEGHGVQRNETRAAEIFRKSCWVEGDHDDGEACFYLAQLFATGKGVNQDLDSASNSKWRACNLGYEKACPPRRRS